MQGMLNITIIKQIRASFSTYGLAVAVLLAPAMHSANLSAEESLAAEENRHSTVGMPANIDQLVLPGSELKAKAIEGDDSPMVLRVARSFPHGDSFRYDLVYYALEPGNYNLTDYLQRVDGTSTDGLPSIAVEVTAILPKEQIEPHQVANKRAPWFGGYTVMLFAGSVVWTIGLALCLLGPKKKTAEEIRANTRPLTFAERLQPLIEQAISGELEPKQKAELERMLINFWQTRLELEGLSITESLTKMRQDEQAGVMLEQLEQWLHRPSGAVEEVDLEDLLKPYRN